MPTTNSPFPLYCILNSLKLLYLFNIKQYTTFSHTIIYTDYRKQKQFIIIDGQIVYLGCPNVYFEDNRFVYYTDYEPFVKKVLTWDEAYLILSKMPLICKARILDDVISNLYRLKWKKEVIDTLTTYKEAQYSLYNKILNKLNIDYMVVPRNFQYLIKKIINIHSYVLIDIGNPIKFIDGDFYSNGLLYINDDYDSEISIKLDINEIKILFNALPLEIRLYIKKLIKEYYKKTPDLSVKIIYDVQNLLIY